MTDAAFPRSKLTPRFEAFSQQVKHIHTTWLVWYRMFFDCDAPHDHSGFNQHTVTWDAIYHALIHDVLLGLARLVDPNELKGRENLTVDQVWQEMSFDKRENLRRSADAARNKFKNHAASPAILRIRHRVLAHNDLATILGDEDVKGEIDAIHKAVQWLCKFQWRCESFYNGRIVDYGAPVSAVHRDSSTDVAVEREIDDLLKRVCPPRSPRAQR